ncbi:MAG: major royal jelly family protein [Actinobacteria bacterium]|nr:major royal jelly family protein [Actinomycetota bacterium]
MTRLVRALLVVAVLIGGLVGLLLLLLGGGENLPDRSTAPSMTFDAVEKVADLDYPPGNIAVSAEGRVFLTLHPDGRPPRQVVELVDGKPVAFPDEAFQRERSDGPWFDSILALRIDRQGRLWTLDFARFGRGTPRLLAFDLASRRVVHEYAFPPEVAGLGSMLNDFQVDAAGRYVFIAETSPVLQQPALVVYDSVEGKSRRLLEGHPSVAAEKLYINVGQRRMMLPGGLLPLRIAVDSIALSRDGAWLYYGAVTASRLYRIRVADLLDETLAPGALGARVKTFADKPLTDGLTTDDDENVYLSDMEHSAIHRLDGAGRLQTLVADPRLRWPDGFSFGPNGMLYVTCSALQDVLFRSPREVARHAPYQVWRLKPGPTAAPGH